MSGNLSSTPNPEDFLDDDMREQLERIHQRMTQLQDLENSKSAQNFETKNGMLTGSEATLGSPPDKAGSPPVDKVCNLNENHLKFYSTNILNGTRNSDSMETSNSISQPQSLTNSEQAPDLIHNSSKKNRGGIVVNGFASMLEHHAEVIAKNPPEVTDTVMDYSAVNLNTVNVTTNLPSYSTKNLPVNFNPFALTPEMKQKSIKTPNRKNDSNGTPKSAGSVNAKSKSLKSLSGKSGSKNLNQIPQPPRSDTKSDKSRHCPGSVSTGKKSQPQLSGSRLSDTFLEDWRVQFPERRESLNSIKFDDITTTELLALCREGRERKNCTEETITVSDISNLNNNAMSLSPNLIGGKKSTLGNPNGMNNKGISQNLSQGTTGTVNVDSKNSIESVKTVFNPSDSLSASRGTATVLNRTYSNTNFDVNANLNGLSNSVGTSIFNASPSLQNSLQNSQGLISAAAVAANVIPPKMPGNVLDNDSILSLSHRSGPTVGETESMYSTVKECAAGKGSTPTLLGQSNQTAPSSQRARNSGVPTPPSGYENHLSNTQSSNMSLKQQNLHTHSQQQHLDPSNLSVAMQEQLRAFCAEETKKLEARLGFCLTPAETPGKQVSSHVRNQFCDEELQAQDESQLVSSTINFPPPSNSISEGDIDGIKKNSIFTNNIACSPNPSDSGSLLERVPAPRVSASHPVPNLHLNQFNDNLQDLEIKTTEKSPGI